MSGYILFKSDYMGGYNKISITLTLSTPTFVSDATKVNNLLATENIFNLIETDIFESLHLFW